MDLKLIYNNNFMRGLLLMLVSLIVFTPIIIVGLIGTPILFFRNFKGFALVKYILGLFLAILEAIGYIFYHIAIGIDILANAASGQLFERLLTNKRRTTFGTGRVTISGSVGLIEKYGHLTKNKWFSKALNIAFNERQHGIAAWERLKLIRIFDKNIKPRR